MMFLVASSKSTILRLAGIFSCLTLVITGLPATGHATEVPAVPPDILIMGDSYAAGNGARDENGNRSYYGPVACMRSWDNWGQKYARTLGAVARNAACSGAVSDGIVNYAEEIVDEWAGQVSGAWDLGSPELLSRIESQHACASIPRSEPEEKYEASVTRTLKIGIGIVGSTWYTAQCKRTLAPQINPSDWQ